MTQRLDTQECPEELADAIAVVGVAGRFPGARTVGEYWRNLVGGVESIVPLDEETLRAHGIDDDALADPGYIRRGAPLAGLDEFDPEIFGIGAAAARTLDPQHRLFLQTVWHAIEDAGYDPHALEGSVGVFGTSSASGYLLNNLMSRLDPQRVIGQGASFEMIDLSLQNDKDHVATRVAHAFDLRGPALSVQTACSSSLLAVHLACQSLLSGETDAAVAGGVSIRVPDSVGYWHEPGAMTSPSGRCRPFDVRADGTVFGSGVGAVVLKTVSRALADGDRIHAVIRGSAVNNDGAGKMTYAAPNAVGQAEVIAEAHAIAGVDASSVSYVETHGTATPLGDPIEIDGLRQAFALASSDRTGPCRLGSVKANIGHLEVASGIAGFIKTVLALRNRELPATLHYTAPNPELHLEQGPFEVQGESAPWEWDGPLRAGVSSFGVGGTNVHVVLEEAPGHETPSTASGPHVLTLSARSPERIDVARVQLADELAADPEISLADVAHTLASRPADAVRLAVAASDVHGAVEALHAGGPPTTAPAGAGADGRTVFLFPGQGSQYVGMAQGLYEGEPVFRDAFDRCAAGFDAALGIDLRATVFRGRPRELERTDRTQPALFAVEYALGKLLEHHGVVPAALVGHSVGEFVAATLAGVMDLPSAVSAVAERATLMQQAPRGAMIAVPLAPDAAAPYLTAGALDVATVNEPGACVVAGTEEDVAALAEKLAADGVAARRVRTSHAFHSRLMAPVVERFTAYMSRVELREPRIPLLSNVTGAPMSGAEATDPGMWGRQIRATVRFADELASVLAQPHRVLVEVGPGGTLTSAAQRHPRWDDGHAVVRLVRHRAQNRDDHEAFRAGLGALWAAGAAVDLAPGTGGRRLLLPGYPFLRDTYWVDYLPAERRSGVGFGSAEAARVDDDPSAGIEDRLARVWAQCLGVDSVDRGGDFFDLGGDSLIAIGVAMAAGHEGIDLTPQDLYDHPTVASLAAALEARYEVGGLARDPSGDAPLPLPPSLARLVSSGLADPAQWRVPIVLRVRRDMGAADVRAVLTALAERHDALRVRLAEVDGVWEQQVDPSTDVSVTTGSGPTAESVQRLTAAGGPSLAAELLTDPDGGPSTLVLALHGLAGEAESRDVLLADLLTGFAQRAAGGDVELAEPPVSWAQWSRRCGSLATHPDVLASRSHWRDALSGASLALPDLPASRRPERSDLVRVGGTLGTVATSEVDDARRRTGIRLEELALAALARAAGSVVGPGRLAVDMGGSARAVLEPDVNLRRTAGAFATVYPVAVDAAAGIDAGAELDAARQAVRAVPHHGLGYGLLRYLHAPTAAAFARLREPDVQLDVVGTVPDAPPHDPAAPVGFDPDTALPVRETVPALGHALTLRVYRAAGALHLDWWYDEQRVSRARVDALAAALQVALPELARSAGAEDDPDVDELELVDLSALGAGGGTA
ncbi:beta-ketoacyl synthase N-terminal-like domain-containing protein [Tsukamurella sp. 8F]|uniref:type I polyketide synthase n=1 Tax=unclassified Tsukamurella TaxID=2633480 RepID=UPI0023B99EE9|nr:MULTISPECIES: type I polyketide synthase [unclassified Tsukamurella]MDF0530496.1 beta-ketoacyl synthase N-terminal-like domain-containing protein [Tsukamurella sp. 8J]MDF0586854.1 beta-ketoacyl synthase N-terminal-like domain-containing protein [Tsukamurella sp. 8F]